MSIARFLPTRRWLWRGLVGVALLSMAFLWKPLLIQWHEGRARQHLRSRQYPRALEELRASLWLAPQRSETILLLARTQRRLGDLATASALLPQAEKYGAAPARIQREQWLLLAQAGQLREAEPHLAALLQDPRDEGAEICEAFVQGYFSNLCVDEASALLDVWTKDYPEDPQPHVMRGYLLQTLAFNPEALTAYRRAAELAPDQPMIRRRLAQILVETGGLDEAGELLRRCVEETPDDTEARMAWMNLLFTQGDTDRAREGLEQLLAKQPACFEARRLLGEMELSQGRLVEALGHLEPAARQRPYDTTTRNALGKTLSALGRKSEAEPHFQYVAEAEPALHRMEQQLRQVLKQPRDPQLRYEIGMTLLKYSSPDDGAKWLRTVLELQPNHPGAQAALGQRTASRDGPRPPAAVPAARDPSDRDSRHPPSATALPITGGESIQLRDVTAQSGISFVHTDGSSGRFFTMEAMTGGLALFDYDGDGLIDIYFVNGAPLPGTLPGTQPRHALYRNLGNWKFSDVSVEANTACTAFGLGLTVGDYNNDGFPDIYLSNFGPNVLYRNNGDGTLSDVTAQAGVARGNRVGAGVCFLDMDGDGDLDLFVANYVQFSYASHRAAQIAGLPFYPGPLDQAAETNVLYRNDGEGTFTDVSVTSGIAAHSGTGMGVIACDYDNDGDTDIFVANDEMANFLFQNDGHGTFREVGIPSGVAYDAAGLPRGSMGVDAGDYDNDGWLDFYVTSYQNELATLYRNLGRGFFHDATRLTGAGAGTLSQVTWGHGFVDFDNDGDRDLFIACGHTDENVERRDKRAAYRTRSILLQNLLVETGQARFSNISDRCGDGLRLLRSSRGTGFDDLDNDGAVDVVVLNSRQLPTVLRNGCHEVGNANHWLQVVLRGVRTNRDGVGARVRVTAGALVQIDEVHSGRGYQSHHGVRLHFGLGVQDQVDRIEVRWIGGGTDVVEHVRADRTVTIIEGQASGQK
ncbi:MAG: FG-GAP-like repeat-containing protein [Planctomycetota bacterium]|nr:FG-GAP-like repeat-containing protein [Planctomycetota bacterium]